MTSVCLLVAGAENPGAQRGSLQGAHQTAPLSSPFYPLIASLQAKQGVLPHLWGPHTQLSP